MRLPCGPCAHRERNRINQALRRGVAPGAVAARTKLTSGQVARHADAHLRSRDVDDPDDVLDDVTPWTRRDAARWTPDDWREVFLDEIARLESMRVCPAEAERAALEALLRLLPPCCDSCGGDVDVERFFVSCGIFNFWD